MTRLLLFDIDGTLLLSGGAGKRALNRTFAELFGVADAFTDIPVAGRTDLLILGDALERGGVAAGAEARARFLTRYCEHFEREILHPGPRKGLMPGVRPLLDRLRRTPGVACALVTGNIARAARIKLEHFGLHRYFVCGAYGDDAPRREDLVPIAVERARRAGIDVDSPREAVVIGDTPLDVRCAPAPSAWRPGRSPRRSCGARGPTPCSRTWRIRSASSPPSVGNLRRKNRADDAEPVLEVGGWRKRLGVEPSPPAQAGSDRF